MPLSSAAAARPREGIGARVLHGLFWRSGSQILAQLVTWAATFLVIRLLRPGDYGVFAMTQSVLALFGMLSGGSFASALVRRETVDRHEIRQVFGLLILLNGGLACVQIALAPWVAAYYRQPIVTDLLRVQALLYVANPFIALGTALLARQMDFRRQAIANFASAIAGAGTALGGALAGLGVWTLVLAPIAMVWTRGLGLAIAARLRVVPRFGFRGAGDIVGFGLAMVTSQIFWFVQTQADVFIGGRALDPRHLGLYTTALFLAQILTSKFVPPMNEIAYAAYARLQSDRAAVASAFARSVRLVMLVALPFQAGMALTAGPLVATVLGPHWAGSAPLVGALAVAMPFVTLQILFAPVTNALGRPRLAVNGAIAGAIIMPAAFLLGIGDGAAGLARAWAFAFPLLTAYTAAISLPVIGLGWRTLGAAIRPALLSTAIMAACVAAADAILPALPPAAHLAALVAVGAPTYAAAAMLLARPAIADLAALAGRRGRA